MRTIFYDDQDLAADLASGGRSIFLAGPTARGVPRTPWRARAIDRLADRGYDGMVIIPEPREGTEEGAMRRIFSHGQSPVPGMSARSRGGGDRSAR